MTRESDYIPPSQLFRTLLLHMLKTHHVLTPYVRHTTSKELKLCHQANAYMLSEIESWLADLTEDMDLTPSFSAAQSVELLVGVESCLHPPTSAPAGEPSTPSAQPVLTDPVPGSSRARSSPRRVSTPVAWERNSTGQIVFRQK